MSGVQPYEDAELDAIALVRLAVAESERGELLSTTLHPLLLRVQDNHTNGVLFLLAALARFAGLLVGQLAGQDGIGADEWLDRWAMHKLEQHESDRDDGPGGHE
jgi:hypothetical protein